MIGNDLADDPGSTAGPPLAKLRALLRGDRFPTNSRLPPERDLAVQLGVSRRALRKALAVLEAEGRIWRNVGKGTFVGGRPIKGPNDLSLVSGLTSPAEVMEARLQLEPGIAGLAALRATTDDLAHMERCLRKSELAPDAETYELWDGTLHRAVAEAARNRLLLALLDAVNAVRTQTAWGRLRRAALTEERQRTYCRQHAAFVAAIAERDSRRAEAAMREHLETVQRNLLGTRLDPLPTAAVGEQAAS